jgi:hypothetical protein
MKSVTALAAAATLAAVLPSAAYAQMGWQAIDQRQLALEHRIDAGMRDGTLTRGEARNLRAEFVNLERLEARYRMNGLNSWERHDLDRRFDALSLQIRDQRSDWQNNDRSYNRHRRW